MNIVPITFEVDLRKLLFLHKPGVRAMTTVHIVFIECEYVGSTALRKDIFERAYGTSF